MASDWRCRSAICAWYWALLCSTWASSPSWTFCSAMTCWRTSFWALRATSRAARWESTRSRCWRAWSRVESTRAARSWACLRRSSKRCTALTWAPTIDSR